MRLLLDTHALLWWVDNAPQLSAAARQHVAAEGNPCFVSLVSAWEMAIKASLGKLKLSVPVQRYFLEHLPSNDFQQLEISLGHVTFVETLPFHHRDPFDRLLVAQAHLEGLVMVSADPVFEHYGITRIW
jgi:PIN domain nuclease of toxin-antitoxin system